ncbi:MAG TPA: GMC family oxidoreductase N-terminal domain-containing protein [Candidatus Acidoferrales bacterium]|nr:GMC family oxidoreductase N-terminal domain-containing protein [Candidatus Acidoferrales bacterium]
MKKAIVVGTGAGGATAAKELCGKFDVTIIEAGGKFHPFGVSLEFLGKARHTGLFFDEREIQFMFPAMRIQKTADRMSLVKGIGLGGTTTLATANAVRCDGELKAIGICLDEEFEELKNEIPITTEHSEIWRRSTRRLFEICEEMNLDPQVMPKMIDYKKCKRCGHCVLGCPEGAKWDTRQFIDEVVSRGALLETNCRVKQVVISHGKATGVMVQQGWLKKFLPADLVVLAAGGFGTPIILSNSGIEIEPRLFVDPVLCVAAESKGVFQNKEVLMPFVVQREHFIISPYFDQLSFFFNRDWRIPAENIASLMVKLADENVGRLNDGAFEKNLTSLDKERLRGGVEICAEILSRFGVSKENIFLGTLNAGHPGGMLPLTSLEAETFHHGRLPENLYIADATLFPRSLGNPPILTIMAMAKRVSRLCVEKFAA